MSNPQNRWVNGLLKLHIVPHCQVMSFLDANLKQLRLVLKRILLLQKSEARMQGIKDRLDAETVEDIEVEETVCLCVYCNPASLLLLLYIQYVSLSRQNRFSVSLSPLLSARLPLEHSLHPHKTTEEAAIPSSFRLKSHAHLIRDIHIHKDATDSCSYIENVSSGTRHFGVIVG